MRNTEYNPVLTTTKHKTMKKLKLWWNREGRYYIRTFKTGVQNIWYWFPIIWKDRNWDYSYIFNIMMHKLKAQAKYIKNKNRYVRAERDAEVMMTCVRLMQLVKDDTYSGEYMDYHKEEHWFEDIEDKPGYYSWESKLIEENFDDYFKKYPLIYKRVLNGEGVFKRKGDDKQVIAMNIAYINHDRARKLLFKIMEENIERWWD